MTIIGIDPGLSGAVATLGADGVLSVIDIPTLQLTRNGKAKRSIDPTALADVLAALAGGSAFVERVGAMPGQGVSSVFSFGRTSGVIIGVLAALRIPVTECTPQAWKKALQVPADKDGARARASQIFPEYSRLWSRVKDDGRAEAALIAEFGRRSLIRG